MKYLLKMGSLKMRMERRGRLDSKAKISAKKDLKITLSLPLDFLQSSECSPL